MPGLEPGIRGNRLGGERLWIAGSSPAMTYSVCLKRVSVLGRIVLERAIGSAFEILELT